jgi:hypothetical protein
MSPRIKVGLFSLAGALAIHVALVACSSNTTRFTTAPEGAARADTPGATAAPCAQWEVQPFAPKSISWTPLSYTDSQGKPQQTSFRSYPSPLQLPQGWEPFGSDIDGSVFARHCIQ